ncbi:MAG TPA: helix-turn-helix domain-containing protein [Urbifossiella sp.]|nr:helix-turn-helix domain-containing protein [Urbifossiella sp.]
MKAGRFREDLIYRLNVIEVTMPPLREHRGDTVSLAEHFLQQFAGREKKPIAGFTSAVVEAIERHRWPGNVRELRNAIERAVLLCRCERIDMGDLPPSVLAAPSSAVALGQDVPIDALEAEHIRRVLAASSSLEEAAQTLGIDPSTLYRKRKRYGL